MLIKLTTGVVAKGHTFEMGDIVDWQCDEDARRMIERGLAAKPAPAESKASEGKVRTYTPPPKRPEDIWPPRPLGKLKREDD